jgi:sec-independent protein translocase protein TatC
MAAKKKKRQRTKTAQRTIHLRSAEQKQAFAEHFGELRKRLFYMALSILAVGAAAYAVEHQLIDILLKPAHGQQFIYTSPVGGVDFLFKVCMYFGIALSVPVIVYHVLKYLEPLIGRDSHRFIVWGTFTSGVLALAGILFGYFVGLPNALHFLLHQFVTAQIKPLVTIQSYMSFVGVYMLGSALLLQAPLILIFINRIRPLTPRGLFGAERWVILLAFVGAGLMNPSPNVLEQLMVAGPLIVMYQIGIAVIWYINRKGSKPAFVRELTVQDDEVQAVRWQKRQNLRPLPTPDLPPKAIDSRKRIAV